jgi:hypothetical protein
MKRYRPIPIISTEENPKRRYVVTKYPEIPRGSSDIYVYVTKGDISKANSNLTSLDTIYPNPGDQIRIPSPSRVTTIISSYELLNRSF